MTIKLIDVLFAATAIDLGLPMVTLDDGYDQIARAHRAHSTSSKSKASMAEGIVPEPTTLVSRTASLLVLSARKRCERPTPGQ